MIRNDFKDIMFISKIEGNYIKGSMTVIYYNNVEYYLYDQLVKKDPKNVKKLINKINFRKNFRLVNYQDNTVLLIRKIIC
jgi:hypothetical protein